MANEINGIGFQIEFGKKLAHGHLLEIVSLVSLRLFALAVLDKYEEILASTLFQDSHQIALQGFFISSRDLLDLWTT